MLAALAICLILLAASFVWISPIVVKVLERGLTEKLLEARELLLKAQALEAQRRAEVDAPLPSVWDNFPDECPHCRSSINLREVVPTLGNQVTYWCGKRLNDNAGRVQADWTKCPRELRTPPA